MIEMGVQDADPEQQAEPASMPLPNGKNVQMSKLAYKETSISTDDVTVVIPVLNEAEGIGQVVDDLRHKGFPRILVVDGRSSDGTPQIAAERGATVIYQHGTGKAGAIRTALDVVTTPYMAVMDGDCTYGAGDLVSLLAYSKDYHEVIGARVKGRENIPRMNRLGNWIVNKAFKLFFAAPTTDVLSGMYVLRTDALRAEGISSQSFDIEAEIASKMASSGMVTEVPIAYGPRRGKEKLGSRHGFRILATLFWMGFYESPLFMFGILSALLAIPAIGLLLWVAYQDLTSGIFHSGYVLLGIMLLLLASQGLGVALMSLVTKRSEHRLRRAIESVKEASG
jgi:dolichol-phosphate hexosyltransferase